MAQSQEGCQRIVVSAVSISLDIAIKKRKCQKVAKFIPKIIKN